jgi:hypothetical protein
LIWIFSLCASFPPSLGGALFSEVYQGLSVFESS